MKSDVLFLNEMYELLCTSRLNVLYYEHRLAQVGRIAFWCDVLCALSASGSGLAATFASAFPLGLTFIQCLSIVAAAIAIAKPIYGPEKRIENLSRQAEFYSGNYFDLKTLSSQISQNARVGVYHKQTYATLYERHRDAARRDEKPPKLKLLRNLMYQVEEELPSTKFWWPN